MVEQQPAGGDGRVGDGPAHAISAGDGAATAVRRGRESVLVDLAHGHAVDAAGCHAELARLNAAAANEIADLRGRQVDVELQLEAVRAELERLRSLPETKVGQRVRHMFRRRSRSAPGVGATIADAAAAAPAGRRTDHGEPARQQVGEVAGAVIVVRNRCGGLESMLDWLTTRGLDEIVIVDDASSDPTTVRTLASLPYDVVRIDQAMGSSAPWATGTVARSSAAGHVVVTDGDTVIGPRTPDDALERASYELRRNSAIDAVELAGVTETDPARRVPGFVVVRRALPYRPVDIVALPPVYATRSISADADPDEPRERFARLNDRSIGGGAS